MPREKEGFHDQYVSLAERFSGREVISIAESCVLLGLHRETLLKQKDFPAKKVGGKYIVPLVALARWMA